MKKTLFWILAVIITVTSAIYQRKTGPTYPKEIEISLQNRSIEFKLPRSGDSNQDQEVSIPALDSAWNISLQYRRYPVKESFTTVSFKTHDDKLIAFLPKQSRAGKLEYFISFKNRTTGAVKQTEHAIIRFKGTVPDSMLIPHILFMFIAMLFSNLAGILALSKSKQHLLYGKLALIFILLGGLVFGPIIQHYAFGQAWTGIPLGWDLTDNKTLIAFVFWLVAVISNRRNPKYRYTIIASVITLIIFSIPHSLFGSELDYTTGKVITGIVQFLF